MTMTDYSWRKSPYLKPERLNDVLAAIQMMALNNRYRQDASAWADRISGDKSKTTYWMALFADHPEFFRESTRYTGHFALVMRRALPRRYDYKLVRMVTSDEYDAMSEAQRDERLSRTPLTEAQLKILMDSAISLHKNALEAHNDWRFWVAPVLSLITAFLGAFLALSVKKT